MSLNKNTVIIYCRLSRTPDGVRGVMSLDSQEHAINIYISEKGWRVYSILKTVGSAYTGKQEDLINTLKICKGKNLVVFEANRLSRNVENFEKIYDICTKNKHKITIVNLGRTFDCDGNKYGLDYVTLLNLIIAAQKESEDMGARISRTLQMKKAQQAPWGKTKDAFGSFVNDIREQNISLLVKLLATEGTSVRKITELVNSLGNTVGKDRFEIIEFDIYNRNDITDVTGRRLPSAMSSGNILETLHYYEIKHRNRKFNRDDVSEIIVTYTLPTGSVVPPVSPPRVPVPGFGVVQVPRSFGVAQVPRLSELKGKIPETPKMSVEDKLVYSFGGMDVDDELDQDFIKIPREETKSQEWICVWYDPKFGLPPNVRVPVGFQLPKEACQVYIPKF